MVKNKEVQIISVNINILFFFSSCLSVTVLKNSPDHLLRNNILYFKSCQKNKTVELDISKISFCKQSRKVFGTCDTNNKCCLLNKQLSIFPVKHYSELLQIIFSPRRPLYIYYTKRQSSSDTQWLQNSLFNFCHREILFLSLGFKSSVTENG